MLSNYLADRIRDATAWYSHLAEDETSGLPFRSDELKPKLSFFEIFKMYESVDSIAKYQAAIVGDVCLRRNVLLRKSSTDRSKPTMGRILLLDTSSTTFDGLAAESSVGFFDEGDCPPWDFWIDYEIKVTPSSVRGLLSAWIPEKYFEITEEAILVSGGESLYWGSEKHAGFDEAIIRSFVEELERTVFAA